MSDADSPSNAATLLFVQYIQRTAAGQYVDFEEFCAEHEDHAEGLKRLNANHEELVEALKFVLPLGTTSVKAMAGAGETDPAHRMRHKRLTDIFTQALRLPKERREAHVRAACKGDGGLFAEVMHLLEAATKSQGPVPQARSDDRLTLGFRRAQAESKEGSADLSEVLRRLSSRGEGYGRYLLKGEIDRGGQGVVLRVWDEDLRRSLAMKIMLGQVDIEHTGETPPVDSKTLGRFLEEAQVTGQLDHPGIVPVHELGLDAEGRVYFTMKLVKGESLAQIFEKVKTGEDGWNQTRALGVLLKVCEAMAYAHDKGVVHRDLKPSNIMVGRFGEVYVMDWGLARVMGRDDQKDIRIKPQPVNTTTELRSERREHDAPDSPLITRDGDVVGTPAYMSPEQARGDLDRIGPQSDVYSIGAILYELLAGHMPYVKPGVRISNYAVWARVQDGPPESLRDRAPLAPSPLAAICIGAMERDPANRYRDVGGVARDLAAFLEGRVTSTYRPTFREKLKRYWKSHSMAVRVSVALAPIFLALARILGFGVGLVPLGGLFFTAVVGFSGAFQRRGARRFSFLACTPLVVLFAALHWDNTTSKVEISRIYPFPEIAVRDAFLKLASPRGSGETRGHSIGHELVHLAVAFTHARRGLLLERGLEVAYSLGEASDVSSDLVLRCWENGGTLRQSDGTVSAICFPGDIHLGEATSLVYIDVPCNSLQVRRFESIDLQDLDLLVEKFREIRGGE